MLFFKHKNHKKWVKSIIIGLVAGIVSFLIVSLAIYIPIPGTGTHTDPREIFTILGSALGGFPASLITGVFSGIATNESSRYASIFTHTLSGLFIAFLYNFYLYKLNTGLLIISWVITILVNFYFILAPGFILGLFIFYSPPDSIFPLYLSIVKGANTEIIYTTVITTAFMSALPKNLRKPIFLKI